MIQRIKNFAKKRKKTTFFIVLMIIVYSILLLTKKSTNEVKQVVSWMTVHPREAIVSVHKYGKIAASGNISVIAPFDGQILKMHYHLGDKVVKGQTLLVLSTDSIEKKKHQAQSDYLQKQEDYQKYLHWESGSEVQKAKQDVLNSQQQFKIAKEKLKDDDFLYKKGIISRDELDQQKQSLQQSQQQIDSAKLSLKDTLKQGDKNNLTIKRLAMEDAKNTLDHIEKQLTHATIISPATGITLKPEQTGEKDSSSFTAVEGEAVTENQNLLTIGNSEHFDVKGSLNQEEINKISTGLAVDITSNAFPSITLTGKIESISQLADEDSSSTPSFPFTIALDTISAKDLKLLRVGLMVDIALETYRNNNALVVPISAVHTDTTGKDYVFIQTKNLKSVKCFVERGPTLPDGVVIKKGLKAGDKVRDVSV